MENIKSIFNHPKPEDPEKDAGLFKWEKPAYKKDDVSRLNNMLKNLCKTKRSKENDKNNHSRSGFSRSKSNDFDFSKKQKVIFKLHNGYTMSSHKRYLETYMPQLEKDEVTEKPELFGSNLQEFKNHMIKNHFKCIISPENQNVDLKILTHHFIRRLEELTGYELYWEACIHKNTEHQHIHLLINGIDKNGQKVRFTKEMIKEEMRNILREAATTMIGERTAEEIQAETLRIPFANRWTKYDERLEKLKGKIYPEFLEPSLQQRITYLTSIKLATKQGNFYTLIPDWKKQLQNFGRYNSFMTEYFAENGQIKLYTGGHISGIVEKTITFDKDESWNDAVILKTPKGKIYVPVYQIYKEELEGKTVEIDLPESQIKKQIADKNIKIISTHDSKRSLER